ncbi:MAG: OB-fold nucleic acid binding domain-containing protein, partial [Solirubrobacteraceae bacterium]
RRSEPDRTRALVVNGIAAGTSAIVTLIFVTTEFTRGAWAVVIVIPLIIYALSRTHRRYEAERALLAAEAPRDAQRPREERRGATRGGHEARGRRARPLGRLEVVVLVDRADLATSRALDLATMLASGASVRAVHFSDDDERSERLRRSWTRLDWGDTPLQTIECPDRRVARAVTELAADLASDGNTEVLLILPRRAFRGLFSRLMHDHTAERIVAAVTPLEHVSATIAPFDVPRLIEATTGSRTASQGAAPTAGAAAPASATTRAGSSQARPRTTPAAPVEATGLAEVSVGIAEPLDVYPSPEGAVPIGSVAHRQRARVAGRVRSVSVQPWSGVPTFECMLVDGSGAITLAFLGRREIAGVSPGARLVAEGAVGSRNGQLAMLNPMWELLEAVDGSDADALPDADQDDTGTG